MIHVISASNRHLYRAQLAEMHQLRTVHFVGECGWKNLTIIDGGEYDQFDDERTVYILALDAQGHVLGGTRARPTDDKSMLNDVFPELIASDMPPMSGPDVWEMGRTFLTHEARKLQKKTGRRLTTDLLIAACEWLNDNGIERIISITSLDIFAMCKSWGWNIRMTGLPIEIPDGPITGLEAANTLADVEGFRRMAGRTSRVSHVVTDTDIAVFGSLEAIEAEFAEARQDEPVVSDQKLPSLGRSA